MLSSSISQGFRRLSVSQVSSGAAALHRPTAAASASLPSLDAVIPDHQQQVRYRSNRSRRGLYNGKDIRSGNNVSFSMKKTKRTFKPNVFKKRVYSETLDEMVRFHLTTSAHRRRSHHNSEYHPCICGPTASSIARVLQTAKTSIDLWKGLSAIALQGARPQSTYFGAGPQPIHLSTKRPHTESRRSLVIISQYP